MIDPAALAVDAMAAEGLTAEKWSNGPGFHYAEHRHLFHKVLYCTEGSITFHKPSGDIELAPGDRLDLPAATPHSATVGADGVSCVEAGKAEL